MTTSSKEALERALVGKNIAEVNVDPPSFGFSHGHPGSVSLTLDDGTIVSFGVGGSSTAPRANAVLNGKVVDLST